MWILNTDTNKWTKKTDGLSKANYDNLKQDLSKVKLYSKTLSGANYLSISNTDNIYEPIAYKDNKSWYVNPVSSIYNTGGIPSNGISIDKTSIDTYNNYLHEYGFTLKNAYTPEKAIIDTNYIQVDIATTEPIIINSLINSIDGVKLIEGQKILVKNQMSTVDLAFSVDPNVYFKGNYYLIDDNVSDSTYNYYSADNGIYTFTNNSLIKATFSYNGYSKLTINVRLGTTNFDKQFRLLRLLNGYFPSEGDPIEFKESHNYIVRHQNDYHDLYENNYFDILKHGTQSYSIDGFTYTIPDRLIYVGDFGVILSKQGTTYSQYLYNENRYNLKFLTEIGPFYWTCGENGSLLKISKIDFSITKIELKEINTLMSISFIDEQKGIVVGKYNTIYYTNDGGYNWNKLVFQGTESYSYNKVIYYSYNVIYIVGENGVFLELNYTDLSSTKWSLTQRNIIKYLTSEDQYELIEDINDMYYTNFTSSWNLGYTGSSGLGINNSKDCLILGANNNNLIIYEINGFVPEYNFTYLSFSQSIGDITSVTRQGTSSNIIISGDDTISFDINNFKNITTTCNLITGTTYSVLSTGVSNRIHDYLGINLYKAGNIGLINSFSYSTLTTTDINTIGVNPKLLVMDYDMANKLNFFDSNYNYRLPISATFNANFLTMSLNYTASTWLDYLSDDYQTYGVNTNTTTDATVRLNTIFSISGTSSLTFSNTVISLTYSDMASLYPIVGSLTQSRFTQFAPVAPVTATYSVFMYKYATIFNLPNGFCSVGDMLQISSDNIVANVMINYSFSGYYYAYNDLNQSILNSVKTADTLTITNLNTFKDFTELEVNFESHPVSQGYKLSYDGGVFTLDPLFNNFTAYKSLESSVTINGNTYSLSYPVTYNQFGYVPNYNLLNYLSSVNSNFSSNKKFYSMPEYSNLPGNAAGSFTINNIYYDSNAGTTWLKNKLVFGSNLEYEYNTLWVNTFVDLTLHTSGGVYTKTQLLITKKYYDSVVGGFAIEFSSKILDVTNVSVNYIDIISRNTLGQISTDLEIFNNLNKPLINKNYLDDTFKYFNFYDNPIKTKINTDSYTKILLSDGDIKKYLTSIIYTDYDHKLVMNVLNINTTRDIIIDNTFDYGGNLAINTIDVNDLYGNQLASAIFIGGTDSSQTLNPSYTGIHTITRIDDYNISLNTPYLNIPTVQDIGTLRLNVFDPFFNYQPINLIDLGIDSMYKIPVILSETNLVKTGLTGSITNYTQNPAVFRLIDGLDINLLSSKYHWILEAEISDAIIGLDANGIVWYKGTWHSGRWFGGTWYSGTWVSGDWYDGMWSSMQITDKVNTVVVGKVSVDNLNSIWYDGRWFDGTWQNGTWWNGRWYAGRWKDGYWYNGIWNGGTWDKGLFAGGIWVQGNWNTGVFNSSNKPSYWVDGKFYSGDFQNGMWYSGSFGENYNIISKFGSLATNSRNATWHGGVFASGNFYSNENGTDVSLIHKYSIWKTGIFNQGNFYGGIAYNIEFQNGQWHGGITQDIEIIGVSNPTYSNTITLNGIFRFNIGDYINIIGNGTSTPYYNLGNYNTPGRYRVANVVFDNTNNWTTVYIDYNFNSLGFTAPYNATQSSNVDTGLRAVSKFKDITWKSGIWGNGVFEGGSFEGGIWYDGVFNPGGNWGV